MPKNSYLSITMQSHFAEVKFYSSVRSNVNLSNHKSEQYFEPLANKYNHQPLPSNHVVYLCFYSLHIQCLVVISEDFCEKHGWHWRLWDSNIRPQLLPTSQLEVGLDSVYLSWTRGCRGDIACQTTQANPWICSVIWHWKVPSIGTSTNSYLTSSLEGFNNCSFHVVLIARENPKEINHSCISCPL